jgi:hypothetical protein
MKLDRLRHLYVEELKDLYSAENQLVKALPKMARASTSGDLRAGFEGHLEQTKEHVARLEKIFKALGESPNGKKCKGIEGLIKEGGELIAEDPAPEELDAGLISLRRSAGGALRNRRLRLCQYLRKDSRRRPVSFAKTLLGFEIKSLRRVAALWPHVITGACSRS